MAELSWTVIAEVSGMPQAELLGSMLQANGIEVALSQESYAHTLGITVGPLSRVQILVNSENLEAAQQIVDDFFAALQDEQPAGDAPEEPAAGDSDLP